MTMAAEDDEERLVTLLELPGETAWAIRQASKVDDEHLVSSIQDDLVEIQDALLAPTLFPGPSTNASKRQEIKAGECFGRVWKRLCISLSQLSSFTCGLRSL